MQALRAYRMKGTEGHDVVIRNDGCRPLLFWETEQSGHRLKASFNTGKACRTHFRRQRETCLFECCLNAEPSGTRGFRGLETGQIINVALRANPERERQISERIPAGRWGRLKIWP